MGPDRISKYLSHLWDDISKRIFDIPFSKRDVESMVHSFKISKSEISPLKVFDDMSKIKRIRLEDENAELDSLRIF